MRGALASSGFGLDLHGDKDMRRDRVLLLCLLLTLAVSLSSSANETKEGEALGIANEAVLLFVFEVCDWLRVSLRASSSSRS